MRFLLQMRVIFEGKVSQVRILTTGVANTSLTEGVLMRVDCLQALNWLHPDPSSRYLSEHCQCQHSKDMWHG